MANELVKRMVKKDGSQRISFYRDEYAENPRDMSDEPLHCEDWSRDYSIMNKQERETKSENACKWIRYMLDRYGNTKEIFKVLRENAKSDKHFDGENCLSIRYSLPLASKIKYPPKLDKFFHGVYRPLSCLDKPYSIALINTVRVVLPQPFSS